MYTIGVLECSKPSKVTFMNGLRPECMVVVSTVKAHEQFKTYSLAKLVGILKSHENVATKEMKVVSSMGSLALLSKGKNMVEEEEELDLSKCDLTNDKYALMVSKPKKFDRKSSLPTRTETGKGATV